VTGGLGALAVNVAGQLPGFQHRFGLGRPIGGIGPDPGASVAPRQQFFHHLAVVHGSIGDPLRAGRRNPRRSPDRAQRRVPQHTRAVCPPASQATQNPDCRLDQPAQENGASPSLNSKNQCLKVVDTFRAELPCAETVPMLLWALLAAGQITMRKVDGWQTLDK
jgi:hypothetical protein